MCHLDHRPLTYLHVLCGRRGHDITPPACSDTQRVPSTALATVNRVYVYRQRFTAQTASPPCITEVWNNKESALLHINEGGVCRQRARAISTPLPVRSN
ncbi:unnamed protein product [Colias eurytheme]|nr:unnamed protein product [Colias eurytheme]